MWLGDIVVTLPKKLYKVLYTVALEKGLLPCRKNLQERTGLKTKNPVNTKVYRVFTAPQPGLEPGTP